MRAEERIKELDDSLDQGDAVNREILVNLGYVLEENLRLTDGLDVRRGDGKIRIKADSKILVQATRRAVMSSIEEGNDEGRIHALFYQWERLIK